MKKIGKLLSSLFINDSISRSVLSVIVSIFAVSTALYMGHLLTSTPAITLSQYLELSALAVIALTLIFSTYTQHQKEIFEESGLFLEKSIDLINKAYDVLSHNGEVTSDRISWVTAARLLKRALALSSEIRITSHQEIFTSEHDYQRHRFSDLLQINGQPLPMEFFFGSGYTLGQVGKSAYKITNNTKISSIKQIAQDWLPTECISIVYRFATFPEHYNDPLIVGENMSPREMDRLWLFGNDGVNNYLKFRKSHSVTPLYIYKRTEKGTIKLTEEDINREYASIFDDPSKIIAETTEN